MHVFCLRAIKICVTATTLNYRTRAYVMLVQARPHNVLCAIAMYYVLCAILLNINKAAVVYSAVVSKKLNVTKQVAI